MIYRAKRLARLCSILSSLTLFGCSSVPAPTEQLAVSRTALDDARSAGAAEYAARDFNDARNKLEQANAAMRQEDYVRARRLAEEAELDARLAQQKSQTAKSQAAVDEIQSSIRALRQELQRSVK